MSLVQYNDPQRFVLENRIVKLKKKNIMNYVKESVSICIQPCSSLGQRQKGHVNI